MNYEELMWAWAEVCYTDFGRPLRINLVDHDPDGCPIIGHVADGEVETKNGEKISVFKMGYRIVETKH